MQSSSPETYPVDSIPSAPYVCGGNLTFRSQRLSFYKMPDQRILSGGTYRQISACFYVFTFCQNIACCLEIKQKLTQICTVKCAKAKQMKDSRYHIFQTICALKKERTAVKSWGLLTSLALLLFSERQQILLMGSQYVASLPQCSSGPFCSRKLLISYLFNCLSGEVDS